MLAWKTGGLNAPFSLCHCVTSSLLAAAVIWATNRPGISVRLSQEEVKLSGTHFPQPLLYIGMRNVSEFSAQLGSDFAKIGAKVCKVSFHLCGSKWPTPAYLRKTTVFRRWFESLRSLHLHQSLASGTPVLHHIGRPDGLKIRLSSRPPPPRMLKSTSTIRAASVPASLLCILVAITRAATV